MDSKLAEQTTLKGKADDEDVCVVCYRPAAIFSIGECDHPVCYECSTRMRVLCGRTECPICRKDMAMVVFTQHIQPFVSIQYRNMKCERRYSIYFEKDYIMKAYDDLLEHICFLCDGYQKFKNFNVLKEHMRKSHERFYCELCIENLKIFTRERRAYSRALLAQHRRIGDTDDKSHKGHPLCEFCDSRFMDNDDLYRHLRRDHFFCHFCDADGNHQYYDDYSALRDHFRADHFLCEEGDCLEERFTSAFRTKLDMQAHTAQTHGHSMSKSEVRQARTVDIAFTVNHRQGHFPERGGRGGGRGGRGGRGGISAGRRHPGDLEDQAAAASAIPPSHMPSKQQAIDINCVQDFPSLKGGVGGPSGDGDPCGDNTANKSIAQKLAQKNRFTIRAMRGQALNEEEFPCLGSTTSVIVSSAPSMVNPSATTPTTSVHLSVNTKKSNNNSVNSKGNSVPNVSIQYNCSNPSSVNHVEVSNNVFEGDRKRKPYIGTISHSGNITVKSSNSGTRPRSALLQEDFPCLKSSGKCLPTDGQTTTWIPHQLAQSNIIPKAPKKLGNNVVNSKLPNTKNSNLFESNDFPCLAPSTESHQQMLSYSGRSSLTIPMKKALATNIERNNENEENSAGGKGKKKKKGVLGKGNSFENNKNSQNIASATATSATTTTVATTAARPSKKKTLILSNVFEDVDDGQPKEDFSKGRKGEYESVVPLASSNIKFVSANDVSSTKKSELQIGTLQAPLPPELDSEGDFPSLGGMKTGDKERKQSSKIISSSNGNRQLSSWTQQTSKKRASVPPGFTNKSNSNMPTNFADTDMTFTSSLGQKFSISPTTVVDSPTTGFTSLLPLKANSRKKEKLSPKNNGSFPSGFMFPPNFEQRNNALINVINDICEGNSDKFKKFKNLAEMLRSGGVKGQEYYERCRQILGKPAFHVILPELLALLPDIEKQQAVLEAYQKLDGGHGCSVCFAVCAVCQQVLISEDFSDHMASHELHLDNFPSLTSTSSAQHRK